MQKTRWLILFLLVFVWSCSDDETGPETLNTEFLVKSEKIYTYSKSLLSSAVSSAVLEYPELAAFVDQLQYDVSVYYVEYKTDYIANSTITASGLVAVPETEGVPTMLLSFQNGTNVEHAEAPSENPVSGDFVVLYAAASLGYTVCVADYIGFGASDDKVHPYHQKFLFQKSIVNMIKAVDELESLGNTALLLNGDLFFTGYSLGGWASLVAHKYVEDNGIAGFNLVGTVCGAGAYNLLEMRDYLLQQTNYVQPYYLPLLLYGFSSTGEIESDLSIYFSEPYASLIPSLYDGLHSGSEINAELTSDVTALLAEGLVADPALPKFNMLTLALQNNSQDAWVNEKPIHFYHGSADVHVPGVISENLVTEFRNLGQDEALIQYTTLTGADHITGSMPMFIQVLAYLQNR